VTVIVAYERRFFEHLPDQYSNSRAHELFTGNTWLAETTARRARAALDSSSAMSRTFC